LRRRSTPGCSPARTTSSRAWTPTTSVCPTASRCSSPCSKPGADLVGSGLLEIGADEYDVVGRRVPPTSPATIARAARLHSPFNHPTVVYRRVAVQGAGGYQHLPLMEDYWLFARMIAAGAVVANVARPLVLYRVGAGAYTRRGGRHLLVAELELQRRLRRSGFTTRRQYLRNVCLRATYRTVPAALRRPAYRLLVATRGEQLERGNPPTPHDLTRRGAPHAVVGAQP
jgi:hypothetical protein